MYINKSELDCTYIYISVQASLVAQLVKNLPAIRETWVRSLGLGRSPGEGKGYPLQYSGLGNSMDCAVHGVTRSWTRLSDFHSLTYIYSSTCMVMYTVNISERLNRKFLIMVTSGY